MAVTSALTGPGTIEQISRIASLKSRPALAISEGLVVTPSTMPVDARSRISAMSAVSTKNFMPLFLSPPRLFDRVARRFSSLNSSRDGGAIAFSLGLYRMPVTHTSFEGDSAEAASAARVRVLLPLPLAGAYDYAVPPGMNVAAGDFVSVPLGARRVAGVVWGQATDEVDAKKVKPIAARLAAPPMSDELRQLIDWVAAYTLSAPGAVLRMAMSVPEALEAERNLVGYGIGETGRAALADEAAKLSAPRRRVLTEASHAPGTAADLARRGACGSGVVKGLTRAGLLEPVELPRRAPLEPPDWRLPGPTLSSAQDVAATELLAKLGQGFSTTFLDGVTGSGKTEVYFAAIGKTLEQ